MVENDEEWKKKIEDAAGEYLFEIIEDEDIPELAESLEKYIGKKEADNLREGKFTKEALKKNALCKYNYNGRQRKS